MENKWEEYIINITYEPKDGHLALQRLDITDNFETRLHRLIKEYQGQAGLKFTAIDSTGRQITEH